MKDIYFFKFKALGLTGFITRPGHLGLAGFVFNGNMHDLCYMKPIRFIQRKATWLRDQLPGCTWRSMYCCDTQRIHAGFLQFNWQRKNGYEGMHGDGPDTISTVSFYQALKLTISGKTRQRYED